MLTASLFFASSTRAQWTGGIKIGTSYTDFSGDLVGGKTTWKRVLGLSAGASFGYELRGGLSAETELLYLRMGAKTNVLYLDIPATLTSKLVYLTMPVLLQYRLQAGQYLSPRFFAGPAGLFNLDALVAVAARPDDELLFEEDESIEALDYGLMAGAALDFDVSDQRLTLEMRYYRGMMDVTKPAGEIGDSVLRNQGFVILIGVLF